MAIQNFFLPLPIQTFVPKNSQLPENAQFQENNQPFVATWLRCRALQFLALCLATAGWLTIAATSGQAAPPVTAEAQVGTEAQVKTERPPQFFTPTEQATIANALLGLGYFLPLGLGLGIFLYDRYANYRSALLQHQIKTLERIWRETARH